MIAFDLATCNHIGDGDKKDMRFSPAESLIDLKMERLWQAEVFLLDGWLVVPSCQKILWFKEGNRCETSTYVDTDDLRNGYTLPCLAVYFLSNKKGSLDGARIKVQAFDDRASKLYKCHKQNNTLKDSGACNK